MVRPGRPRPVGPQVGVVATAHSDCGEFVYEVREPGPSARAERDLYSVLEDFADAELRRPCTCQGAVERLEAGVGPKYERATDRIVDGSRRSDSRWSTTRCQICSVLAS